MKRHQSKIKIEKDTQDQIYEWITIGLMMMFCVMVMYYYNDLPERIPTHFGLSGEADAYGHKGTLWMLLALGLALPSLMMFLTRYPHSFNYPFKITEENAAYEYRMAVKLMLWMAMAIAMIFLVICWGIIQTSLGHQDGLSRYLLLFVLVLTFAPIVNYLLVGWFGRKEA